MQEGLNVTNAVLHLLLVVLAMTVEAVVVVEVVVISEEEAVVVVEVGDMGIIEEVDQGTMMEAEVMTTLVEGAMIVEVEGAIGGVHSVVVKVGMMVDMVKFLLLLPHHMVVVLVETTHLLMVGMQATEQMQFLHLQAILVDQIHILLHTGVAWVVMVGIIKVMHGVVVGLGLQLVIGVDLVELLLLLSPQLR